MTFRLLPSLLLFLFSLSIFPPPLITEILASESTPSASVAQLKEEASNSSALESKPSESATHSSEATSSGKDSESSDKNPIETVISEIKEAATSVINKIFSIEEIKDPNSDFIYEYKLSETEKVSFQEKQTKKPGFALEGEDKSQFRFLLKDGTQSELDKNAPISREDSSIEFPVTIKDIPMTLRYTVEPGKVKEEFIIKEKPDNSKLENLGENLTIPFDLKLKDLEVEKIGEGYIFKSQKSEISWQVLPPIVTDAKGNKGQIKLDIPNPETASLSVNSGFLKNASYPVIIDPTVVSSNGNVFNNTQKNMLRTADGTVHALVSSTQSYTCNGSSKTGLLWFTSTNEGTSWTCQEQIGSSSSHRGSMTKDSLDNIYVVYGASTDILYRKLSRSGASWTVGDSQTAVTPSGSITGYQASDVAVEGTSRIWISSKSLNTSSEFNVAVFYSDSQNSAPTWTQSTAALASNSSTSNNNHNSITRFGTKIGVLYSNGTNLSFRYRDDADGLTSWNSESTPITGTTGTINSRFSSTVDSSNNLHVAAHTNITASSPGPLKYNFFNGSSWATEVSVASSNLFGATTSSVKISTDGTSVWIFYPDRTGFAGSADIGRPGYKKGVSPFGSGDFDASSTAFNSYEKTYDKVWMYDSSGNSYAEETTDAASTNSADVTFAGDIGDIFYLGMLEPYRAIGPYLSTNGVTGVIAYEYWNGSTWATLTTNGSVSPNLTSCASASVNSACGTWFNPPADWATTAVNGEGTPYYYVRGRLTTGYTVTPVGTQLRALNKINSLTTEPGELGITKIFAGWGNNVNSSTPITFLAGSINTGSNAAPTAPTSLGPSAVTDGDDIDDDTPDFDFTIADANGSDTVQYQFQLDNNSDFSSPLVDYTSALGTTGAKTFTVGQSAGSGTYSAGTQGQTLGENPYYWRVRAKDNSGAIGPYTYANSGSMAFSIDETAPTAPGIPTATTPTIDTTPTWTWTASTDAASGLANPAYTIEWSQDNTFSGGVSSSTSNTNSFTHSVDLALGTWYSRVKSEDLAGFESEWSETGIVEIVDRDKISIQTPTTAATFNSISVYASFEGDDNENATSYVEYKKSSDSDWIRGMDLSGDRRDDVTSQGLTFTNTYDNQFRGSVLMVDSNTTYDVRVTFSDPDGVIGGSGSNTNQVTTTATTRNETPTTGTATTYYVSTTGSNSNDGLTEGTPFLTIQNAANLAVPGDTILIRGGTYTSAAGPILNMTRSGDANNYIDFRSYPGETAILDASSTTSSCGGGTGSGYKCSIRTNAKYLRFKDLEITGGNIGIKMDEPAEYVFIDNNNFEGLVNSGNQGTAPASVAVMIGNNAGSTQIDVGHVVVQNNTIVSPITGDADDDESVGLISFWNTNGGHIIRNNNISYDFDGVLDRHGGDCIAGGTNAYISSGPHKDTDIYNNICTNPTDDGIELDGGAINVRVWNNTISGANLGVSIAPVIVGPAYVFRNTFSGLKVHWTTGCAGIKSGETGTGDTFIYQNTFYSANDDPDCANTTATYASNGSDGPSENVYMKNNIMLGGWRIYNVGKTDEDVTADYNVLYQANTSGGTFAKWRNVFYSSFATFKSGSSLELNSVNAQPLFENADSLDFDLTKASAGIDSGTLLYGFNDRNSYWPYQGTAPDAGAIESAFSTASTDNGSNNSSSGNNSSSNPGNSSSSSCSAQAPAAPDLFQIDATNTSATLYITKPWGNVSKYQISYGYDESASNFATTIDSNNTWINPITINQLSPNSIYYFKASAINDCVGGPQSPAIAIKTTGRPNQQTKFYKNSKPLQKTLSNLKSGTARAITNTQTAPQAITTPLAPSAPKPPSVLQPPKTQVSPNAPAPQNNPGFFGQIINTVKSWFGF